MKITLTKEEKKFVDSLIASGQYVSANDVICSSLMLLRESFKSNKQRFEELRESLLIAAKEAENGESTTIPSMNEFVEEIKKI